MNLYYSKNDPNSGSPLNSDKNWCGWTLELDDDNRIQIQCENPDESRIGDFIKGIVRCEFDKPLLEHQSKYIRYREYQTVFSFWSFDLDDKEEKTAFFLMVDWLCEKTGTTENEFNEYEDIFRNK